MTEIKSGTTIQSLQIGFSIVELVASYDQPLKFNDIQEKTQITKSNLYKYLNTLTLSGILYRDKENGLYSLGSKLVELGMKALNKEEMIERVTPFLQEINRTCKQTVLLTSWSQSGPVVVKMINSHQGLNIGAQIGTLLPILSAAGKVYAAFMEEAVIGVWSKQQLTTLDEERGLKLKTEIEAIRLHGISFASEPLVPSISSVALPIINFQKSLLGAVVIVGFSDALPTHIDEVMSQYLLKVNKEICAIFGCKG
ncbi:MULTISPECIES: IclR family transcriptional regulator [Paenibacillus]|uniref:IclR family transcriptional regulator n=1 Tax=Paenibacillus baimaensis TaxID=2982185 RepID=A0ABT2UDD2_9BACL|nr:MULTISPECIES: IclR family transcriptional regulator [unclassified Paenibacillus]MCU6792658.1 IclR family transcriptional regulator [Paenibacillus sp. WQ 127069]OMF08796.1 IclR family transcriptional regulator [Paenibacillus sp. FSL H7-0331]